MSNRFGTSAIRQQGTQDSRFLAEEFPMALLVTLKCQNHGFTLPEQITEPKEASTSVCNTDTTTHWFFRIHGFRPIGHTAPESAKIRRTQFHIQSVNDQADSHSRSTTHQKQSKHATLGSGIARKSDHKQSARSKDERYAFCAILRSRLVKPQGYAQPRRKHQPIQATNHHSNAIAPLE